MAKLFHYKKTDKTAICGIATQRLTLERDSVTCKGCIQELVVLAQPSDLRKEKRANRKQIQPPNTFGDYKRVGPLEMDAYGLLPADGLGRLSSEDY